MGADTPAQSHPSPLTSSVSPFGSRGHGVVESLLAPPKALSNQHSTPKSGPHMSTSQQHFPTSDPTIMSLFTF